MKILVYLDWPATEGLKPPSSFTTLLLPALCESLAGHEVLVWTYGLERPPGLVLPGNPEWTAFPGKNGLAGWWWRFRTLPSRIRAAAPDHLLVVNAASPLKGIKHSLLVEGNRNFTICRGSGKDRGPAAIFRFGAFAPHAPKDIQPVPVIDVHLVRPASAGFGPLEPASMEATRLVHTGGRSYFIYMGPLDPGVTDLVKAFSVFKKRQKSDWKLVLAGQGEINRKFVESLSYYKYREDLVLFRETNPAIMPSLIGAAYAVLVPAGGGTEWLPEVLAAGVPAIVPDQPAFRGSADETFSFYDTVSQTDIAETMMTLYKDESLRNRRRQAGLALATAASWQDLARQITAHLLK
ncbi:MAG: glycosyltransferase [Chitinophagaceae bacterium]|nr:MAG: glycosyltransferase [Chitinophagaceae bacterium]